MTHEEIEVYDELDMRDPDRSQTHIDINDSRSSDGSVEESDPEYFDDSKHKGAGPTSPTSSSDDESDIEGAYPLPVGDVTCWKLVRGPRDFVRLTWGWLRANKNQYLSGVTVALAQIPEAVSFSFVAGVDPIVGLQSAWIMGIVTSLVGGRPGMVAGSTGAVAVVLTTIVEEHGIGYMFYAIMLAGIIQMAFGLLRLGVLIRMVPHSVMVGFVNGLGIVIAVAQFNIFKVRDDAEDDGERRRLFEIGGAFAPFTNGLPWVEWQMAVWMIFLVAVTLITYIVFPKFTKAIPGSLAGIIVSTVLEWAFIRQIGFETNTVEDIASVKGTFPVPVWIDDEYGYSDVMPPLNGETIGIIFPTAITAAIIGLLESLLTLQLIDELTNTKGSSNREAFGQGLGQFLSGMLGGMGGCTTIGQSLMNIHSGGYTRLSSSVAAIFMLIIILAAYPLINLIPVASLAGVMFVVAYFTIEWESAKVVLGSLLPMKYRQKFGIHTKVKRSDVIVMLIVVAVTLILDLATAVGVGIVLACLVFAWDSSTRINLERAVSDGGQKVFYTISGPLFFGSTKPLMELFPNPKEEPKEVVILLHNCEIYDWSGMVAIKALHDRFENNDCTVKFESLAVASHKLMMKSASLWEGVDVFKQEDYEEDPLVQRPHVDNPLDAHL